MTEYVLGLAFTPSHQQVLLIEKNRPRWQAGSLNGVGGKIETGEKPIDAMMREFQEEVGIPTSPLHWTHEDTVSGDDFEMYIFTSVRVDLHQAVTMTDEKPQIVSVNDLELLPLVSGLDAWIQTWISHRSR